MIDPKRICLVSIHTQDYHTLGDLTWHQNKSIYCEKYGYDRVLQVQPSPYMEKDKYILIKSIIDEKRHDYIFWCDCDTLVTNFSKRIEDLFDENYDFIVSSDCHGLNLGVFLLKVSNKGLTFLDFILNNIDRVNTRFAFGEGQTLIQDLHKQGRFSDTIKVIPQKLMNSYPYKYYGHPDGQNDLLGVNGNWEKGDFILHIPGFGPDLYHKRMEHFNIYIKEVIK